MKQTVGKNIARYRKEQHLTQRELAELLHISYQAVSKWENGQSMPDVYLLPRLAAVLHTSVDQLMGYSHEYEKDNVYEKRYQMEGYYWGVQPSELCLDILRLMPPEKPLRVLDAGCGEGKDAVFLARCGYQVSAFDLSISGVEKTKQLAEQAGVWVDAFRADIMDFRLDREFDIIYSSGVFGFILPQLRQEILENYKLFTSVGGINVFHVFVEKPFIGKAPDAGQEYPWKSGELFLHYHDWYMEKCSEVVFECDSSGVLHKHAADVMIARKGFGTQGL